MQNVRGELSRSGVGVETAGQEERLANDVLIQLSPGQTGGSVWEERSLSSQMCENTWVGWVLFTVSFHRQDTWKGGISAKLHCLHTNRANAQQLLRMEEQEHFNCVTILSWTNIQAPGCESNSWTLGITLESHEGGRLIGEGRWRDEVELIGVCVFSLNYASFACACESQWENRLLNPFLGEFIDWRSWWRQSKRKKVWNVTAGYDQQGEYFFLNQK